MNWKRKSVQNVISEPTAWFIKNTWKLIPLEERFEDNIDKPQNNKVLLIPLWMSPWFSILFSMSWLLMLYYFKKCSKSLLFRIRAKTNQMHLFFKDEQKKWFLFLF